MAKYYYITKDGKQLGPIEPNEFLSHGINKNSFVFSKGMKTWKKAGDIPELTYLFSTHSNAYPPLEIKRSPPLNQTPHQQQETLSHKTSRQPISQKPENYRTWAILLSLTIIFCCSIFGFLGVVALVKSHQTDDYYSQGKYDEAQKASEEAHHYIKLGVIATLIQLLLQLIIIIIAAIAEAV